MGYIKAEEILPDEIIEMIQQYVDGASIYIPRKENKRAGWGQINRAKEQLYARDIKIYQEHRQGATVRELAERHYLSEKSIWRILHKIKNNCNGGAGV